MSTATEAIGGETTKVVNPKRVELVNGNVRVTVSLVPRKQFKYPSDKRFRTKPKTIPSCTTKT